MDMNDMILSGLFLNPFSFLIHAEKTAVGSKDIFYSRQIERREDLVLIIGKCNKICNQLLRRSGIDTENHTCIMNPEKDITAFSVRKGADRIKQRLWQISLCFLIFNLIVFAVPDQLQKFFWQ